MTELLETVFLTLIRPRSVMARCSAGVPLWWSLAVYGTVYVFGYLYNLIALRNLPSSPLALNVSAAWLFVFGAGFSLLVWLGSAGIWFLLAQLLGGTGSSVRLFAALGFASLPAIVGDAAGALLFLAGRGSAASTPLVVAAVWGLVLEVLAVKETTGVSAGRALTVVFAPAMLLLLTIILGFAAFWPYR